MDDGFQCLVDTNTCFGGHLDRVRRFDANHVFDLFSHTGAIRGGKIDLVKDRHNLVIRIQSVVHVGQCLGLDALRGINHQQRAFNRAHGAGDLIGEIDVAGGVDQVQNVIFAIVRFIVDADCVGFDGDATLTFDVHGVQKLGLHVTVFNGTGLLNEPICEGRFPMVNVRDDGEIADM